MENQEIAWLLKEKYQGEKSDAFFADSERLLAGEPLAYIIGSLPFLNCQIALDSHPLIPRPETEYWTEQAINAIKAESSRRDLVVRGLASNKLPVSVLDLCAGSGAIGVAVAKAVPAAHVTFAEIDPAHLPTIKKNLSENLTPEQNDFSGQYEIVASDLFTIVTGNFDFILTNPPYIDKVANTVDDSVIAHEPALALFGGNVGMEIITNIIRGAKTYLNDDGQLWIEHEPFQCDAIATLAAEYQFSVMHHQDQYGTYRYSVLSPLVAK